MRPLKKILASTVLLTPLAATAGPLVHINKADIYEFQSDLIGVSEKTAQAIVDYRRENGRFESLYDLLNVEGVERDFININRDYMHLGDDPRLEQKV